MKFFTPERKANYDWWKENEKELFRKYDGKCVLVDDKQVIADGSSGEEMHEKAANLGLPKDSYLILIVGRAVNTTIVEM